MLKRGNHHPCRVLRGSTPDGGDVFALFCPDQLIEASTDRRPKDPTIFSSIIRSFTETGLQAPSGWTFLTGLKLADMRDGSLRLELLAKNPQRMLQKSHGPSGALRLLLPDSFDADEAEPSLSSQLVKYALEERLTNPTRGQDAININTPVTLSAWNNSRRGQEPKLINFYRRLGFQVQGGEGDPYVSMKSTVGRILKKSSKKKMPRRSRSRSRSRSRPRL